MPWEGIIHRKFDGITPNQICWNPFPSTRPLRVLNQNYMTFDGNTGSRFAQLYFSSQDFENIIASFITPYYNPQTNEFQRLKRSTHIPPAILLSTKVIDQGNIRMRNQMFPLTDPLNINFEMKTAKRIVIPPRTVEFEITPVGKHDFDHCIENFYNMQSTAFIVSSRYPRFDRKIFLDSNSQYMI